MAEQPVETIIDTVPGRDLAGEHQKWLSGLPGQISRDYREEWATHEDFRQMAVANKWRHYSEFDAGGVEMIWRFTSKPASEFINISAGTSIDKIIQVIGKHSGGNDKSNADVRTSSFCRNIGALLGTAASTGGDKNVVKIINQAEYLVGIDIRSLAAHGISAHPALHRLISMFETEYVLVSTPGNAPVSIETLATFKYPNPFKGLIGANGVVAKYGIDIFMSDPSKTFSTPLPPVVADVITTTGQADEQWVKRVLQSGGTWCKAARPFGGIVQMKEGMADADIKARAMRGYLQIK